MTIPHNDSPMMVITPDRGAPGSKLFKQNPGLFVNKMVTRDYLKSIAISRFHWEGLPDGLTSDRFEQLLFLGGIWGAAPLYGKPVIGRVAQEGILTFYGDMQEIQVIGQNGGMVHGRVWPESERDSVIMWPHTSRHISALEIVEYYADKMCDLEMLMSQNISALAMPFVFETDARNQNDMLDYFRAVAGWKPYIGVTDEFNVNDKVKVRTTNAPVLMQDICITKHDYMQEFLTVMGIDNSNTDKRERVQSAEALSNNEQIMVNRRSWLKPRKMFCEEYNKVFGTNLSVTYDVGEWTDTDELSWVSEGLYQDANGGGYGEYSNDSNRKPETD